MASPLFERVCSLAVGPLVWSGLRITFDVERTGSPKPNKSEIVVYGLSADSRRIVERKGAEVRLLAGYASNAGLIFHGEVVEAEHTRDGASWASTITARDGQTAWGKYTSRAFGAAVSHADLVSALAADLGLAVSAATLATLRATTTRRGVALHGHAHRELDTVLRSLGMEWSIQDGTLQVLAAGATTTEPDVLLSQSTGLVGVPERLEAEIGKRARTRIVSLMQPGLRPGRGVQVSSAVLSGRFRVERVSHRGDTHGSEWQSECECVEAVT